MKHPLLNALTDLDELSWLRRIKLTDLTDLANLSTFPFVKMLYSKFKSELVYCKTHH